jgi:membrane protease YdiL (CAAX protease family)
MNEAEFFSETPLPTLGRKRSRRAVVRSAFLVWLTSVFATVILFLLSKSSFERHAWVQFLIVDVTFVFGSILLLTRDKITLQEAGCSTPTQPISWLLNLAILLGVQIAGSVVLFAMNAPDSSVSSLSFGQRLLWICGLAPIAEEFFLRGWFQTAYMRAPAEGKAVSGIVASAAFFALMHLFVGTSPVRIAVTFAGAFLSGLVYANVRQASGSLFPSILMHSAFNMSGWLMARPLWTVITKIRS